MKNQGSKKPHVSRQDIVTGLRELGLKRGDVVGVHSSLNSFGYVEGGADTIIDALLEVVGEDGTIVMSAYSNNRIEVERTPEENKMGVTWKYKILPYDPKKASCWTGVIPETFRKRKGVLRSLHPTHSIATLGKHAKEIVGADGGRDSMAGWRKLMELNGYILLLGVRLDSCSSMHLVEERVQLPKHILYMITSPKELVEKYPEDEWDVGFGPYPDFLIMEEPCLERKMMKTVKVGNATLKLVRLRDLIDLFEEYLRKNADQFYSILKMDLSFDKVKEEKSKFLESHHVIVLATSCDNRVTARTVTYATKGLEIYFMSWDHHKKILQIKENPKVALCKDNISIEGVAEILGNPLDERNNEYAEIYKEKLPRDFTGFANLPGMVMVKVTPTLIVSWVRRHNRFFLEYLDLKNKRAYLMKPEETLEY